MDRATCGITTESRWTRDDFLKRAGAGGLVIVGLPSLADPALAAYRATRKTLKIGFFGAFSGPLALSGLDLRRGFDLYLTTRKGQLGGRPVEVVYEDDAGNPAQALTKVRKLVEQDRVTILVGGVSAATGPPLHGYVNQVGMPWVNSLIAADVMTQRLPNSYMIRLGESASQASHYFGEWVRKTLKYERVAVIGSDFLLGYEVAAGFQDVFQRMGGSVVQKSWAPLGTADFSPFLSRIERDVDAVFAVFASFDAVRFITQYYQFGLKSQIPLIGGWTTADEVVLAAQGLPVEAALGITTAGRYSAVLRSKANDEFQRRYNARYRGESVGSSTAADGWTTGLAIELALKRRPDTSNRRKFAAAFKGLVIPNAPRGPITIGPDLNPVHNTYIRRVTLSGRNLPPGYTLPLANTVIVTRRNTNQYWKFDKDSYLSRPPYSRDHPPTRG